MKQTLIFLVITFSLFSCYYSGNGGIECPNDGEIVPVIVDYDAIILSSQTEVDNFGNNSKTKINRSIIIGNSPTPNVDPITDLSALCKITSINGYLCIIRNPLLTNIEGLNNLTYVTENLEISNNTSLKNLEGLNNLESVSENLYITSNRNLINLKGLSNLSYVKESISLTGNKSLMNIDALKNITTIEKKLDIRYNDELENINGFSNISTIGSKLTILYNPSLTNFCGIHQIILNGYSGDYDVYGNGKNPKQEDIINNNNCFQ